jgi:DNA-binding beta-propeller fold protein YncE
MRNLLIFVLLIPALAADQKLALPGHPFKLAISNDGQWVFAALSGAGDTAGIGVIRRDGADLKLIRMARVNPAPSGIVLTHDGKTLIASNGEGAVFLDVERLISGQGNPEIGALKEPGSTASIYVNVTRDDKTLFISEEAARAITVVDVARRSIIGTIPVGNAPIALTFSPDEKRLYTTSQSAAPDWSWPAVCDPENPQGKGPKHPEGAVIVIDVAKARTDPEHSIVTKAHAACNPVRLAISEKGDRAYVTARKTNAVLAFDTEKLVTDPDHAQVGSVEVGTAPVPIIVIGDRVIAGNSNRFGTAGSGDQSLTVIDRLKMQAIGNIPAGQFPRDLIVSPDGKTLLLANYGSSTVQAVNLPLQ